MQDAGDRIVFGPSDDGGYYLIGMKQLHRRVFEDIDWSTERVAQQTLERAAEIGVAVELLPTCFDVDDRATLRRLCDELLFHGRDNYAAQNRAVFSRRSSRAKVAIEFGLTNE